MNKLEKILAQSVTPEMVSEHLTEQEIEEVIEEYETKIANAEDDIESATERELVWRERAEYAEGCLKFAEGWKHFVESEVEKVEVWRSVVNKAKQALKGKETSPNERRAKLIEEAKEYIKDNRKGIKLNVNKKNKTITVNNGELWYYPSHLVWNKHLAKAFVVALRNVDTGNAYKFSSNKIQPTEIVEGMDVEIYSKNGTTKKFFARGRVSFFDSSSGKIKFSTIKKIRSGVPSYLEGKQPIYHVVSDGFKILSDTKANYKEDKK